VIDDGAAPFEVELTVSLSIVRLTRETDDRLRAARVSFMHEPDDVNEYARILRCPVRVRASWNGWALSRESLRLPLRRSDRAMQRWLERLAAGLSAPVPARDDFTAQVRRALLTQLTGAESSLAVVARRLATTPRTLQRRLADAGTSFDAMRDAARKHAAERYLADTDLSIAEVAFVLGFSEPTAFHRAFKRWHKVTPQTFRDRTLRTERTRRTERTQRTREPSEPAS
jgi:AraC-like DNA-binding protein